MPPTYLIQQGIERVSIGAELVEMLGCGSIRQFVGAALLFRTHGTEPLQITHHTEFAGSERSRVYLQRNQHLLQQICRTGALSHKLSKFRG